MSKATILLLLLSVSYSVTFGQRMISNRYYVPLAFHKSALMGDTNLALLRPIKYIISAPHGFFIVGSYVDPFKAEIQKKIVSADSVVYQIRRPVIRNKDFKEVVQGDSTGNDLMFFLIDYPHSKDQLTFVIKNTKHKKEMRIAFIQIGRRPIIHIHPEGIHMGIAKFSY